MKALLVSAALFSLASALPCTAQTNAAPASVSIKADFVLMRSSDVDTSYVSFDTLSTVVPSGQSPAVPDNQAVLQYAIGYPVTLLHQKLLQRTALTAMTETLFSASAVFTPSDVPVTLTFDENVPDALQSDFTTAFPASLPHVRQVFQLQGSLTFIPHVNANKSITLGFSLPPDSLAPQTAKGQVFLLPSVANGGTLLMRNFYPVTGVKLSLSSVGLLRSRWTLLTFITPTIAADTK